SYATQPGNVAQDGTDGHSPYTAALANAFRKPGLDLFAVFNETGLNVKQRTGGTQQPWVPSAPIASQLYFTGAPDPQAAGGKDDAVEIAFWNSVKDDKAPDAFQTYLEAYPQGKFAALARLKLKQLTETSKPASAPQVTEQLPRPTSPEPAGSTQVAVGIYPPAQGQSAVGKAKVDRLVMGLIEKYRDYWRPWINGTPDHMIQHDPVFEWLVEVAPDGQYKPWLADSWELAQDGRSWRVKLHKGVQFHHGYGEVSAEDVVHSHALWCDDTYPGRKDPTVVGYKNGICTVNRIEVVNDYEVVMHCKVVCLEWPFYYSSASTVVIFSKAQWDKEGEMALETRPAGTGPYIFKERAPDRYVLFERAPTPHWKWGTVDWKELQMTWTYEEPTRLAQFIAGETHLTELNKDLIDEAVSKG